MPRVGMIVTSRRCKKCRWSTGYKNLTPPGDPKKRDTWFCMNEKISEVTLVCQGEGIGYVAKENNRVG